MKNIFKIILLTGIILLGFIFPVSAQYALNSDSADAKLTYADTYHYYTGLTRDTLGAGKLTWSYTYWKQADGKFANYTQVKLDSVSGAKTTVSVLFQTKLNKYDTYTTDSTVVWYGTSHDTLIKYNAETARAYPYRRIYVSSAGTFKVKINQLRQLFLK